MGVVVGVLVDLSCGGGIGHFVLLFDGFPKEAMSEKEYSFWLN